MQHPPRNNPQPSPTGCSWVTQNRTPGQLAPHRSRRSVPIRSKPHHSQRGTGLPTRPGREAGPCSTGAFELWSSPTDSGVVTVGSSELQCNVRRAVEIAVLAGDRRGRGRLDPPHELNEQDGGEFLSVPVRWSGRIRVCVRAAAIVIGRRRRSAPGLHNAQPRIPVAGVAVDTTAAEIVRGIFDGNGFDHCPSRTVACGNDCDEIPHEAPDTDTTPAHAAPTAATAAQDLSASLEAHATRVGCVG